MKIKRLIATMLVSLALLIGLLAGGLGGVMGSVPAAEANPCSANVDNADSEGENNTVAVGGGQGSGDDCNQAPPAEEEE
jgi:hypothetical protein